MRIALWGAFDVDDLDDLATRRVVEQGLRVRLPGSEVTAFSPLGALRPLAVDGGRSAKTLPLRSAATITELAERFDCVFVCGGDTLVGAEWATALWGDGAEAAALFVDGLGPEAESACPVVWAGVALSDDLEPAAMERIAAAAPRRTPIVAVGDGSRRRFAEAGVSGEVGVVPPFALLLPDRLDPALLQRRAALLRMMSWAAPAGPVLTVAGDGSLLGTTGEIAEVLLPLIESGEATVQLAATGRLRGEDRFAGALQSALGGRCRRLPEVASLEDLAAAIAGSTGFLGSPGVGLWLAVAMGVPSATPAVSGRSDEADDLLAELGVARPSPMELTGALPRLLGGDGPRPDAGAARERVERHLDALASLALRAACRRSRPAGTRAGEAEPTPEELLDWLRQAHEARGQRRFAERRAFQAAHDDAVAGLHASLAEARDEAARLRSELAAARAANDRMVASRTWRYTQPVRDSLAWVRERRR